MGEGGFGGGVIGVEGFAEFAGWERGWVRFSALMSFRSALRSLVDSLLFMMHCVPVFGYLNLHSASPPSLIFSENPKLHRSIIRPYFLFRHSANLLLRLTSTPHKDDRDIPQPLTPLAFLLPHLDQPPEKLPDDEEPASQVRLEGLVPLREGHFV